MDISPVSRGLTIFFNMYCQRQDGLTGFFMRTCRKQLVALPFSSTLIRQFGYRDYTRCVVLLGATALGVAIYALYKWARKETMVFGVYINTTQSGPIANDRQFKFGQRIKNIEGSPLQITAEDFYVELGFSGKKFSFLDAQGIPTSWLYLPSCLFKDKKEGDVVSFIYDNKKIELILNQNCQKQGVSFDEALQQTRLSNKSHRNQCLWLADTDNFTFFHRELLGHQLTHWTLGNAEQCVVETKDLEFYKQDSDNFCTYCWLQGHHEKNGQENIFTFDVLSEDLLGRERGITSHVEDADIHFMRFQGVNGLDDLWILIPHKNRENNQWPSDTFSISGLHGEMFDGPNAPLRQVTYTDSRGTITSRRFDPNSSDHLCWYRHGSYAKLPIPENHTYEIKKVDCIDGIQRLQVVIFPEAK